MRMPFKLISRVVVVILACSTLFISTDSQSASLRHASRVSGRGSVAAAGLFIGFGGGKAEYGPISVVVTPSIAGRDTYVTIQVSIDRTQSGVTGNVVVNLSNNDPSQFSTWPTSVTIPSTSSSASVTARTSHWDTGSLVTITATSTVGTATTTLTTLSSIIY
jgi:hypothetical protein